MHALARRRALFGAGATIPTDSLAREIVDRRRKRHLSSARYGRDSSLSAVTTRVSSTTKHAHGVGAADFLASSDRRTSR